MNNDDLPIIPLPLAGDEVFYFRFDPASRSLAVVSTSEANPRPMPENAACVALKEITARFEGQSLKGGRA